MIVIDPRPVVHRLRLGDVRRGSGLLVWDGPGRVLPIERDTEVLDLWALLEARGVPDRSPRHRRAVALAAKGAIRVVNGVPLTTAADLVWYFGLYQRVAESIAAHGIVSLDELDAAPTGVGRHDGAATDYPGVALWEHGQLLWFGEGRHRATIAQWLGVGPMPVSLRVVSSDWLDEQAASTSRDPDDVLRVRLQQLDRRGQPPVHEMAHEWLASLDRSVTFPDERLDPYGINGVVTEALEAHRKGQLEAADEIWERVGPPDAVPPFVNVLAARTALALGAMADVTSRLDEVFAAHPTHIAAHETAADAARDADDLEAEIEHLEVVFSEDEGGAKAGLRLTGKLLMAKRLDRAGEVLESLEGLELDEQSLELLEHHRERLGARKAWIAERDAQIALRVGDRPG